MMENSAVSIVAAALFLPFLPQILAVSFGLWVGDRGLASHGLRAISVSALTCVGAGALVALLHGGSMTFSGFQSPLAGFGISLVIGIAAGLAIADDAGRRYLIGVAAAVQVGVFPAWFGICAILGFPDLNTVAERLGAFAVNIATIAGAAAGVYAVTGRRAGTVSSG